MAGCYAHHVDCGCADASVTHCEEINGVHVACCGAQAPHANDAHGRGREGEFSAQVALREGVRASGTADAAQSKFDSSRWSRVCPR